tara:strand:+ start:1108 stop:2187 length:1080 start_codon:yes stop_codon:yes gene_type:complete
MSKIALITGVTGQDGSYLAELLLKKGYIVHGLKRRSSSFNTQRLESIYKDPHESSTNFYLHHGDLTDSLNVLNLVNKIKPDEIYNLAAMSHVHVSFEMPEYVANVDAIGTLRILESVKTLGLENKTRIYHASTSELYGKVQETPQNEKTPFHPRSPYAAAKIYAYWITRNYRDAYGIFASNGILFNHESPRRGETFVTRKITRAIARIALGLQKSIILGNLNSKRDWGHAKDFVYAMWLILQHEKPDDFVISTGAQISIRDFIIKAFKKIGVEIEFQGAGIEEIGYISSNTGIYDNLKVGEKVIAVDEFYFRPTEVESLIGDYSKAKNDLGWEPKYSLDDLIDEMIEADLVEAKKSLNN